MDDNGAVGGDIGTQHAKEHDGTENKTDLDQDLY